MPLTGIGRIGSDIAENRPGDALGTATDMAAKGLAMLGPAGMAAGAALSAVKMGAEAVSETIQAFVQRGRELAQYNGRLAGAVANTDVNNIMADIKEADRFGDKMATLIEKQNQLDLTMRELIAPVKEFLLNVLIKILDGILAAIQGILEVVNNWSLHRVGSETLEEVKKIRDMFKGTPDSDIAGWLAAGKGFRGPFPPLGPEPIPAGIPLGIPLIGR